MTSSERPAVDGELCTCGRQAVTVFVTEKTVLVTNQLTMKTEPVTGKRETGYCGLGDGGDRGPCVFCGGAEEHEPGSACPRYRLRLEQEEAPTDD